jgi:hypothetical protein
VALTGHLVLSTLHTNDAASGITRLTDIGLEPYLVASSVEAFIAQRLVRVLCSGCKREVPPEKDDPILTEMRKQIAADMGLSSLREAKVFAGQGCAACNGTGFFGRTAIYEILLMDSVMRELVVKKAPSAQIKKIAVSRGMRTLRQDGWMKVMQGVTTVEEVVKVTQAEEVAMQEFARASALVAAAPQAEESAFGQKMEDLSPGDKRNYARLHSRVNLRFKVFDSMDQAASRGYKPENLTVTGNLSAGGLLFYANESVAVSSLVEVKLELPDSPDSIVCLAKVIRVEEIEPGRKYNIAVQYLDITSANRARINKFVLE